MFNEKTIDGRTPKRPQRGENVFPPKEGPFWFLAFGGDVQALLLLLYCLEKEPDPEIRLRSLSIRLRSADVTLSYCGLVNVRTTGHFGLSACQGNQGTKLTSPQTCTVGFLMGISHRYIPFSGAIRTCSRHVFISHNHKNIANSVCHQSLIHPSASFSSAPELPLD